MKLMKQLLLTLLLTINSYSGIFARSQRISGYTDSLLYSFTLHNLTTSANPQWIEMGAPVPIGAVPDTLGLVVKNAAGQRLQYQQFDSKAAMNGTLRFAVASFQSPSIAAGDSVRLYVHRTTLPLSNTNTATFNAIKSANFTVDITVDETVWTASCNDALDNNCKVTSSGSARKSWRAYRSFYDGDTEHTQMWVCWYVDLWADGNISVMPKITNGWFSSGQAYTISTWAFKTGETTIRSGSNLAQHHHSSWFACDTLGRPYFTRATPKYHHKYNPLLFGDAGITHYYPPITPYYNRTGVNYYTAGTYGSIEPNTGNTGDRPDIGPLPTWSTTALATQGREDCRFDYTNALAWAWAPINYINKATGEIVSLDSMPHADMGTSYPDGGWFDREAGGHSYMSTGGTGSWAGTGGAEQIDPSHLPEAILHPYTRYGYYWLLDQILITSNHMVGQGDWRYRNAPIGGKSYYGQSGREWQERIIAWAMRSKNNASYVCPNNHIAKAYIDTLTARDYAVHAAWWGGAGSVSNRALCAYGGMVYEFAGWGLPWHENFLGLVTTLHNKRGYNVQSVIDNPLSKFMLGGAYVEGGLWNSATYLMMLADSDTSNMYTSWSNITKRTCDTYEWGPYLKDTLALNPDCWSAGPIGYAAIMKALAQSTLQNTIVTDSAYVKAVKVDSLYAIVFTVPINDWNANNKYYIRRRSLCDYTQEY